MMADEIDGVISFAGQDWWYHGPAHCDFQVARQLADEMPVLIVNSIGMRMPTRDNSDAVWQRIWRKARSTARYLRRPEAGRVHLYVMTPVSVPVFGHERLRLLNARFVALQVALVRRFVVKVRQPAVIVVVPTALDVVHAMHLPIDVYYRADDHAATAGVDHALVRSLEDRLMTEASVTAYSSAALMDAEVDRPRNRAIHVDHGVEIDHFDPEAVGPEPAVTRAIPHPRIGFFGQIEPESIDLELLERLAEHADHQLVLIGRAAMDLSAFAARANVHLLGWQPYAQLPAIAKHFDVAICPMPASPWVGAANPIKIKEYLALGLPVVSRDIPHLHLHAGELQLASTDDEFADAVQAAIDTGGIGTPASRRRSVLGDTWQARSVQLIDEIRAGRSLHSRPTSRPKQAAHHG